MSTIDSNIAIIKGIHPGFILERELKERKLPKRRFAISINEYPQLLGDITKVKERSIHRCLFESGKLWTWMKVFSVFFKPTMISSRKRKNNPTWYILTLRNSVLLYFGIQILKQLIGRKINPALSSEYLKGEMKRRSMKSSVFTGKKIFLRY